MGWSVANTEDVGHWTAERLGTAFTPERATTLGLKKNGETVAGVIYEGFNGRSIRAHIVVEGGLVRYFLWAIFDYPFRICGVEKIVCPVEETNVKSRRLAENMGFAEEARLKDCHPNGDIILYTLRKADCRFLTGRYRERPTEAASGS